MEGAGPAEAGGHTSHDSDSDREEDDRPVHEMPVYLSQNLSEQLFLFQYPLSSSSNPFQNPVVDCKFKPQNQQARIDLSLDTDDDRYSHSKGEQIALNTDGSKNEQRKAPFFKSGMMDKIRLESTQPIKDGSKYAVMIIRDGEAHITPLKGILQLRPSFCYFDKQDKRTKEEKDKENEDDEEIEAKQVTVSFARNESEKLKKARESSYNFLQRKSLEEPWCDLMYYLSTSDKAEIERSKLLACSSTTPAHDVVLDLSASDYILSLVPPDKEALSTEGSSDVVNLKDLKKLPLPEQCKILLKDAKLVTVGYAANILGVSGPSLLNALAASGRLLKGGRWAARSNLLYPPGSSSPHSGVPDNIMCRARDYVLYLFTQAQYVERSKVADAVKLPPEEVKEILSSVAHYQKGSKGWELFIPPDPEFSSKYPDIEQRQALYWDATQRQFNEMLTGEPLTPKRQRKKSQRDSISSDSGMQSPKVRTNSMSYAQKENTVNSDNESGSDNKKSNNNRKLPTMTTCKRTKQSTGRAINDNSRVS